MPEPQPAYHAIGEQLDAGTRRQLRAHFLAMRADGISIVATAERALAALGEPVEPAVRTRGERRDGRMALTNGGQEDG